MLLLLLNEGGANPHTGGAQSIYVSRIQKFGDAEACVGVYSCEVRVGSVSVTLVTKRLTERERSNNMRVCCKRGT